MTTTLTGLVELLAPNVQLVTAPAGPEVPVGRSVFFDSGQLGAVVAGDVVLGVGVGTTDDAVAALAAVSGRKPAAVLLRTHAISGDVVRQARRSGIAVISGADGTRWEDLHALISAALLAAELPGAGAAGVTETHELFELSDSMASLLGGPITIADPDSHVLAYSALHWPDDDVRRESILGRQVHPRWRAWLEEHNIHRQLRAPGDIVEIAEGAMAPNSMRRLVTGIHAGSHVLGYLWAAEGEHGFAPDAREKLLEASTLAALPLARRQLGMDVVTDPRRHLLTTLLHGHGSARQLAGALGIDADTPTVIIAVRSAAAADPAQIARALRLLRLHFEALHRPVATTSIDRTIYTVTTASQGAATRPLVELTRDWVKQLQVAMRQAHHAGVSAARPLSGVYQSRWEADAVLRVLGGAATASRAAGIDEVRTDVTLHELTDFFASRPHLTMHGLSALADHDAGQHTEYVASLVAYLEAFGDIRRAAAKLRIHPNSLRYRLRRIEEISGIDLDDPDERFLVQLQLRVRDWTSRNGTAES